MMFVLLYLYAYALDIKNKIISTTTEPFLEENAITFPKSTDRFTYMTRLTYARQRWANDAN